MFGGDLVSLQPLVSTLINIGVYTSVTLRALFCDDTDKRFSVRGLKRGAP